MNTYPHFSDKGIFARTLYGEARGEVKKYGQKAFEAIGHVILNRFFENKWYGNTIEEICLKPFQFSCWNKKDPNYPLLIQSKILDGLFLQCERIAHLFVEQMNFERNDFTKGANHYHHLLVKPNWSINQKPTIVIGNHVFYKL